MSDYVPGGGGDVNVRDSDSETLLYEAARAGDVRKCERLLSRGADTEAADIAGRTPLHVAAYRGHTAVCQVLLQAGAAVNHANKYGETPLHWAAWYGHTDVCQVLLQAGAAVDHATKRGATPLSSAAYQKQYRVCQLLITKYGADCQHESVRQYLDKMLVWAAEQEDMKMIAPLIEAGADINYKNNKGQTPVDLILASDKTDDPVYKMVALYNAARGQRGESSTV